MKNFAIFPLSKETFTIRTYSILESFFRNLHSKATFERKLASVSLALGLLHGTPAAGVSQALWCGTRNGITELSQRAPPIFGMGGHHVGRRLGIGPHSSFILSRRESNLFNIVMFLSTVYRDIHVA